MNGEDLGEGELWKAGGGGELHIPLGQSEFEVPVRCQIAMSSGQLDVWAWSSGAKSGEKISIWKQPLGKKQGPSSGSESHHKQSDTDGQRCQCTPLLSQLQQNLLNMQMFSLGNLWSLQVTNSATLLPSLQPLKLPFWVPTSQTSLAKTMAREPTADSLCQ